MDKESFIAQLSASLEQLPESERSRFLDYYTEMIDDRIEEGMSETEAVAGLGSPQDIAHEIMLEQPLSTLVKTRVVQREQGKGMNVLLTVLLVLGFPVWFSVGIAVLAVVFSIYLVIWTLVATVFIVDAAIGLAGIACVLAAAFAHSNIVAMLGVLGCGFVLAGLSVLLFFPAKMAAAWLIKLTGTLARSIKSLFIRRAK